MPFPKITTEQMAFLIAALNRNRLQQPQTDTDNDFFVGGPLEEAAAAPSITQPREFGEQTVLRLLEEITTGLIAELTTAGFGEVDSEGSFILPTDFRDGVYLTVAENLFTENPDLGLIEFGEGPKAAVDVDDVIFVNALTRKHDIIGRYGDTPLESQRTAAIITGMNAEPNGGISDDVKAVILATLRGREPRPPSSGVGSQIHADALSILEDVRTNQDTILLQARDETGNVQKSVRTLLENDTPEARATGESSFSFLSTVSPAALERQTQSVEDLEGFASDPGSMADFLLAERNRTSDSLELIDKEGRDIHSNAVRRLKNLAKKLFQDIAGDDQTLIRTEVAQSVLDTLGQQIDSGIFDQFLQDSEITTDAVKVKNFSSSKAEVKNRAESLLGQDITELMTPERLQITAKLFHDAGSTAELDEFLERNARLFATELSNQEFLDLAPAKREANIRGRLGFGEDPDFRGPSSGDRPKTFADAQQKALAASQADAVSRIDRIIRSTIQADPFADISSIGETTFALPSQPRTLDSGDELGFRTRDEAGLGVDRSAQGVVDRLRESREAQPAIEGLLPFQVEGSFSQAQQFGVNVPTPFDPLGSTPPSINSFFQPVRRDADPSLRGLSDAFALATQGAPEGFGSFLQTQFSSLSEQARRETREGNRLIERFRPRFNEATGRIEEVSLGKRRPTFKSTATTAAVLRRETPRLLSEFAAQEPDAIETPTERRRRLRGSGGRIRGVIGRV